MARIFEKKKNPLTPSFKNANKQNRKENKPSTWKYKNRVDISIALISDVC